MRLRKHGPWLVAITALLAVTISPFAIAAGEGNPLRGGVRNPSPDESRALTRETEVIANTSTYGTRQSNKGSGGGAIYGCRAAAGASTPCVRAINLNNGRAFEFATGGALGGRIEAVGGDNAKPFTTNATGVATGLNADRVDGLSAEQIIAQARSGASVTCPSGTAPFGGACVETAPRAAQDFQGASDACAADGRRLAATTQLISFRKRGGVTLNGSEMTSDIVISGNDPAYAVVSEQGAVATRALSTASPFRCVAPAVAPAAG